MGKINWRRVFLGGVLAGIVANLLEMVWGFLMQKQFETAMTAEQMRAAMKPTVMAAHLAWSFVVAIAAIWLYAAIRPRYGPGAATAVRAGFAVWLLAHATFSLATGTMELLPQRIMWMSAAWSLPETLLATLAGARIYGES